MEKYRFWFEKPRAEERNFRDREHNLDNDGSYQNVLQPANANPNDPWADWFNAGLDPEPFTDPFGTGTEQDTYFNYGVNPSYAPAESGPTTSWQAIPWDQSPTFPWFLEEAETKGQPGEMPAAARVEQDDRSEGERERERKSDPLIVAGPEMPREEEGPTADYLFGSKQEEPAWAGEAGFWPAETGVASGISGALEIELKEETGLKEEETESREENGLNLEPESKEEPPLKEENQMAEETLGKEGTINKEAAIDQGKLMGQAETVNKDEAVATESVNIEDTRNEQKTEVDRKIIVWRKFPQKSI
ncbi:MAG: hypothetical protein GX081_11585 [Firmicutes bacterium]|nr:hypothetical protein [Bacillota bacterium]